MCAGSGAQCSAIFFVGESNDVYAMQLLQQITTLSFASGVIRMDSLKRLNNVFFQKNHKLNFLRCYLLYLSFIFTFASIDLES